MQTSRTVWTLALGATVSLARAGTAAPTSATALPAPRMAPGMATAQSDPGLTLDDSIAIALANHGNVGAAQQSFVGAQQRITASRSALYPQANLSTNSQFAAGTSSTSSGGTGSSFSTGSSISTQTNLSLSQTIFDAGRSRAEVRQSQAAAKGAEAGIGVARSGLAFQVAQAFYEQLREEKLIAQRQEQVGLAQGQLDQIEAQIEAGTAARVDADSVRVTLSRRALIWSQRKTTSALPPLLFATRSACHAARP